MDERNFVMVSMTWMETGSEFHYYSICLNEIQPLRQKSDFRSTDRAIEKIDLLKITLYNSMIKKKKKKHTIQYKNRQKIWTDFSPVKIYKQMANKHMTRYSSLVIRKTQSRTTTTHGNMAVRMGKANNNKH